MKRFALLAALLFSGAAFAQPQPIEVLPDGYISLARGQTKILQFDESISKITIVQKGIIDTEPLTDRQISVAGVAQGVTMFVVFGQGGKQLYSATVSVTPEPGQLVKIYGLDEKNQDVGGGGYSAVWCNDRGCGRPDIDLPKPTSIVVERVTGGRAPPRR